MSIPEVFKIKAQLAKLSFAKALFYQIDTVVLSLYIFLKKFHLSFSQKKAREEILSVTGSIRNPNLSDRPNMPYVEAVIQEIQRLGNIAPFGLPHSTLKSGVWIGNTYIPKGNSYLVLT